MYTCILRARVYVAFCEAMSTLLLDRQRIIVLYKYKPFLIVSVHMNVEIINAGIHVQMHAFIYSYAHIYLVVKVHYNNWGDYDS